MSTLPSTMKAVRIHPDPQRKYTPTNPAPVTALHLDQVSVPVCKQPGETLVQIQASTVVRDMLTWPEMLEVDYFIPGSDLSGIVVSTYDSSSTFKPGDEVFGFGYFDAGRIGAWAEYSVLKDKELALKPKNLDWAEAASVPLSALTAYQALFTHGGLDHTLLRSPSGSAQSTNENHGKKVLITGSTGAVGLWLVQMAAAAGVEHVVAATSSAARSKADLLALGATEVITYDELSNHDKDCHVIVDTAGGSVLPKLWSRAAEHATIVSVDSFTSDFVKENKESANHREDVKGVWFIVEPSFDDLSVISDALAKKRMKTFVDQSFALNDVRAAYEAAAVRSSRRGKVVLTVS